MILMRENPFRGPLERAGHENWDFLGPEMETSEASAIWAPKIFKTVLGIHCTLVDIVGDTLD